MATSQAIACAVCGTHVMLTFADIPFEPFGRSQCPTCNNDVALQWKNGGGVPKWKADEKLDHPIYFWVCVKMSEAWYNPFTKFDFVANSVGGIYPDYIGDTFCVEAHSKQEAIDKVKIVVKELHKAIVGYRINYNNKVSTKRRELLQNHNITECVWFKEKK